jgi:hypothetical protein
MVLLVEQVKECRLQSSPRDLPFAFLQIVNSPFVYQESMFEGKGENIVHIVCVVRVLYA